MGLINGIKGVMLAVEFGNCEMEQNCYKKGVEHGEEGVRLRVAVTEKQ